MRFLTTNTPAGRLEYLAIMVVMYVVNFFAATMLLELQIDAVTQEFSYSTQQIAPFAFIYVGNFIFGLITILRRMKDLHMGSGWIILHFIPLVNILFHLNLLISSGMKRQTYAPFGDNPYNPDSWVAKPATDGSAGPAVTFQGQALMLPGEDGWQRQDDAA